MTNKFVSSSDDILNRVRMLLAQKDKAYGPNNLLKFGATGIMIRMSDKMARLENLLEKNCDSFDESVEDTLLDLIGYAINLLRMLD